MLGLGNDRTIRVALLCNTNKTRKIGLFAQIYRKENNSFQRNVFSLWIFKKLKALYGPGYGKFATFL